MLATSTHLEPLSGSSKHSQSIKPHVPTTEELSSCTRELRSPDTFAVFPQPLQAVPKFAYMRGTTEAFEKVATIWNTIWRNFASLGVKNTFSHWIFGILHACKYANTDANGSSCFLTQWSAVILPFLSYRHQPFSSNGAYPSFLLGNTADWLSSNCSPPLGSSSVSTFSLFTCLTVFTFSIAVLQGSKAC